MFVQLFFLQESSSCRKVQKLQDEANEWIHQNQGKITVSSVDTKFSGTGAGGGSSGSTYGKLGMLIQILYEATEPIKEEARRD